MLKVLIYIIKNQRYQKHIPSFASKAHYPFLNLNWKMIRRLMSYRQKLRFAKLYFNKINNKNKEISLEKRQNFNKSILKVKERKKIRKIKRIIKILVIIKSMKILITNKSSKSQN